VVIHAKCLNCATYVSGGFQGQTTDDGHTLYFPSAGSRCVNPKHKMPTDPDDICQDHTLAAHMLKDTVLGPWIPARSESA